MRRALWWGLAFSLALHVALGFLAGRYRPPSNDVAEDVVESSVTTIARTPRPSPTPSPKPVSTATPLRLHEGIALVSRSIAAPLKLHVVRSTAIAHAATERAYVPPARGSENGAPGGNANGRDAPAGGERGNPAPAPSCPTVRVPAHVTRVQEPDIPDGVTASDAVTLVLVRLGANGQVLATSIYKSSGDHRLDDAALKSAQGSDYAPDVVDCVPVGGDYIFRVIFE